MQVCSRAVVSVQKRDVVIRHRTPEDQSDCAHFSIEACWVATTSEALFAKVSKDSNERIASLSMKPRENLVERGRRSSGA